MQETQTPRQVKPKGAFTIRVEPDDHGKRLDFFLAEHLDNANRSRVSDSIKKNEIFVNGKIKKPSYKIKAGECITGMISQPTPPTFKPENIPLEILHEDEHLVVINKQAGLVVHPAPGHWTGTLVQGLLHHFPEIKPSDGDLRPGIVHRLDRDTSGVMVVAKNSQVLFKLCEQFRSRDVSKSYFALVFGRVKKDSGIIDLPVGRHPVDRKRMSTVSPRGKYAETHFKVEKRFTDATLLTCDIKTGRTHQIRVHCLSMNHPLVGDQVYTTRQFTAFKGSSPQSGKILRQIKRQMLHSRCLKFTHPVTETPLEFEAPLPIDMQDVIQQLQNEIKN